MLRLGVQFAQDRHAVLHLIALNLLRHHELHALLVYLAAELTEHVRLIVLATKTDHEYRSCIGMMNHVAKNLLRVLVVITELRAAVVVRESEDIVRTCLLTQTLGTFLNDTVHATYGRDNPHLVADAYLSVFATVAHESTSLVGDVQHHVLGMILVG